MSTALLQFDAATHTYTRAGVVLPSVTQILESVGIIDYRMIPGETREAALKRGSDVHVLTHYDDEWDLAEESVEPHLAGYLAAWRNWRLMSSIGQLDITRIEHRMYHERLDYAGTLDRVFGDQFIVDIKTGSLPWWVRIQLAGYRELLDPDRNKAYRRIGVELHKDGTFKEHECPMAHYDHDLDTFHAALRVVHEKAAN